VFKHSIFLRIYAGLVVLVMLLAVFCYLLVQIINYQRAQEYRESLTDGISYVISEGVSRQPEKQKLTGFQMLLIYLNFQFIMLRQIKLSFRTEKKRIEEQKSVVRYDAKIALLTSLLV
jgi:two-component system sensor histidine kinase RstB